MKDNEKFLSLYREYETLIRGKGLDPKDIEDQSDELTGNRLRMCRNIRNYLSHQNDPGFIAISASMLTFLEKRVTELKQEEDVIKKHLKTPAAGVVNPTDKCFDAMNKLIKLKTDKIVVTDKSVYGIASIYDVAAKLAEGKPKTVKMSDVKVKKSGFCFAEPLAKMKDLPDDVVIICTSDGTAEGKLIGVRY